MSLIVNNLKLNKITTDSCNRSARDIIKKNPTLMHYLQVGETCEYYAQYYTITRLSMISILMS